MKIAVAASEMFPYAKSGGLADAVGGFVRELSRHRETLGIIPLYGMIERKKFGIRKTAIAFSVELSDDSYPIEIYRAQEGNVFFVHHPLLCEGESLYESERNDLRFGLFSHAVCVLVRDYYPVDVLHLHDWHTALVAPLAKERYGLRCGILLTIHNLAFQGIFEKEAIETLRLGWELFTMEKLEFYNRVNFLKGGIVYADAVNTVSPTYAQEVLHSEYGCHLEGFLRRHVPKITGILNGIDEEEFDPANDPALDFPLSRRSLKPKEKEKGALCERLGFSDAHLPLFVYVGRMSDQKGIRELAELVRHIKDAPLNIVILGSGEPYFEALWHPYAHCPNIRVILGYDEATSRRLYAAADFFLMPSKYEPCGLAQMIAMRYGAIPIVRKTGGLRDSVVDFTDRSPVRPHRSGVGIVMEHNDLVSFMGAIIKALGLYADGKTRRDIILSNMKMRFSWSEPVREYLELYGSIMPGGRR